MNKLLRVVSGKKEDGIIFINQDAEIFMSDLEKGKEITYNLNVNRGLYIHVIDGSLNVNNDSLLSGDAVKITEENQIKISANVNSKIILFDLVLDFKN